MPVPLPNAPLSALVGAGADEPGIGGENQPEPAPIDLRSKPIPMMPTPAEPKLSYPGDEKPLSEKPAPGGWGDWDVAACTFEFKLGVGDDEVPESGDE